jgi:hypothetical protein
VNALRTWFRTANGATRRAAALTALLVAGLVVALTQVPLPLQVRAFPVPGQSVVAHPDGRRLLVQQEHGIAIVDAATGGVTATVPLGTLVPGPGIAIAPGTSDAVVLATAPASGNYRNTVNVTVDMDRAVVRSVTRNRDVSDDAVADVRSLGVDRTGAVIVGNAEPFAVGTDGRVWWSRQDGIEGVPGSGPYGYYRMSIAPGGRLLYAARSDRALVVDTATGRIEQDLRMAHSGDLVWRDWTMLLAGDGEHVFVSKPCDSRITVRTLDGAVVAVVETGARAGARRIALSPDGATLYAALADRLLAVDVGAYT